MKKLGVPSKLTIFAMLAFSMMCLLFASGCSWYKYQTPKGKNGRKFMSAGLTANPGNVAVAMADAEVIRADAEAVRRCARNPKTCQAMALARTAGYYGGNVLDTPYGYTWAGVQAVNAYKDKTPKKQGSTGKSLKKLEIMIKGVSDAQNKYFEIQKNKKRGNK